MKPRNREELNKLVSETTIETYEELAPQLMQLIEQAQNRTDLTGEQLQAELMLSMMAYIKSCTNEIIAEVFAQVLEFE